jgi:hypothetical protein
MLQRLICWVWGHKFIYMVRPNVVTVGDVWVAKRSKYCLRCGKAT